MFERYKEFPEWVRWILFTPLWFLTIIISGFFIKFINQQVQPIFLIEGIIFPVAGTGLVVFTAGFLIPQRKKELCYIISGLLLLLSMHCLFSIFYPQVFSNTLDWNDLIKCTFSFAGAVGATLVVRAQH